MPVIVSAAQIKTVKDAIASVKTNAQAVAAIDAATEAAQVMGAQIRYVGGPIRVQAANDLDAYAARVAPFRPTFASAPAVGPVVAAWAQAQTQILNLYMLAFVLESTMPSGTDFGDGWGNAIKYAISILPQTIGNALQAGAGAVSDTVTAAIWGFVKGAWPILAIAGGGLVLFIVAKRTVVKELSPLQDGEESEEG